MIRNRDLKNDLTEMNHRLELIETVLLVSNPDSAMAADAYDGLRRTVIQSLQATHVLRAALAQLDSVASATDDIEDLRVIIRALMSESEVTRIEAYEVRPDAFQRIGGGPVFRVTTPAYVTSPGMPPVQMGVVETVYGEPPGPPTPVPRLKTDDTEAMDLVDPAEIEIESRRTGDTE